MKPPTTILITRPTGQHQAFVARVQALGLSVSHLPCLEIEPLHDAVLNKDPSEHVDSILFTSANAVWQAHRQRALPWTNLAIYAIGSATAFALEALGQPLAIRPQSPFNSESFLRQLSPQKPGHILLIKGCGGRGLLAPELKNMGWQVSSANVYRRRLPDVSPREISRLLQKNPPDLISTTSNESLQNLVILAADHLAELLELPLVVNSARAAELALDLGFSRPALIAIPPGDEGQLECIRRWLSH